MGLHLVEPDHPNFKWDNNKRKFGWRVSVHTPPVHWEICLAVPPMHRILRSIFRLDVPLVLINTHVSGTPTGRQPKTVANMPPEDGEILTQDYLHGESPSATKIMAKGIARRVYRSCTVAPSSCASNHDSSKDRD